MENIENIKIINVDPNEKITAPLVTVIYNIMESIEFFKDINVRQMGADSLKEILEKSDIFLLEQKSLIFGYVRIERERNEDGKRYLIIGLRSEYRNLGFGTAVLTNIIDEYDLIDSELLLKVNATNKRCIAMFNKIKTIQEVSNKDEVIIYKIGQSDE